MNQPIIDEIEKEISLIDLTKKLVTSMDMKLHSHLVKLKTLILLSKV